MLSVLSTPWTKPAAIHAAQRRALRAATARRKATGVSAAPAALRAGSARPRTRPAARSAVDVAVVARGAGRCRSGRASATSRTSTDDRVGEGSSPRSSVLAGLEQAERLRRRDAERLQHRGRQHLAHAALERQPAVAAARPRRLPAALGRQVEQAAVLDVAQLREEEAAAVAERGVVRAELVAVVAQRERLAAGCRAAARSARSGPPTRRPSSAPRPTRSAQRWLRWRSVCRGKPCRLDDVVEGVAELRMQGRGTIGRGDGHPRLGYERRPMPGRKRPVRRPQSR